MNCAPDPCLCCEPWAMPPGTTWPLRVDWSAFIDSVPGWTLAAVTTAEIVKLSGGSTAQPAPPEEIAIVSGYDPPTPETSPGWTKMMGDGTGSNFMTETLVQTAADVAIGNVYRFNLCIKLVDCANRSMTQCTCVTIQVQLC